jgi:hypothetical protein
MTSYEIVKLLQEISTTINDKANVKQLLSKASEYRAEVNRQTDQLLTDLHLGQGMTLLSNLQRDLVQIYAPNFRYVRAKAVFAELSQLESDLGALQNSLEGSNSAPGISNILTNLISNITIFSGTYEQFNAAPFPSVQLVLSLIESGDELNKSIQDCSNALILARDGWYPLEDGTPEYSVIDLFLPSASSYDDILAKVIAIDAIYSDLCTLLNISKIEYPLRVLKIETGSLWTWLSGNETVATLFVELLKGVGSYFGKKRTPEGRIDIASKKADLVEKIWGLRDRLAAAGGNTADLDDRLKNVTSSLADNTIRLLGGESSFSINHQTYLINQGFQGPNKQLQGNKIHLLEDDTSGTRS